MSDSKEIAILAGVFLAIYFAIARFMGFPVGETFLGAVAVAVLGGLCIAWSYGLLWFMKESD